MEILSHIRFVAGFVYVAFIAINIILVVYDKREPVKALSWIIVMVALPVVGLVFYLFFGRNHRKQKLFSRKGLSDLEAIENITRQQIYGLSVPQLPNIKEITQNKDIITLLLNSSKAPLTSYNKLEYYNTGSGTFEAIITALEGATKFIHLEYYIFEGKDNIGKQIAELLMAKAKSGVEVRMIYDDVGSWGLSAKLCKKMSDAGVKVRCFMPVVFPWLTSNVNYRNHRKILIVDGKVAFTGGVNIADRYITGSSFGIWRDAHLRIEGQAAIMLQVIFATDWYFVSGERLDQPEKYLYHSELSDQLVMQIASSGPDSDWDSIMQAFFAAINKARRHIYISTPYFLPNQAILTALKVAGLSGIDIRLMMPRRSDSKIALWASRSYISELLEAGVKVYLFEKGFNHSKLVTIDGTFASVGSANMDIRSFEDNFEVSAFIYDEKITRSIEENFLKDLEMCRLVSPQIWATRGTFNHIIEAVARLFSPLL